MRSQPAQADTLPPSTAAERTAAATAAFVAGTVVWARVKGWPAWPALVMTHEDALNVRVPGAAGVPSGICVFRLNIGNVHAQLHMHVWPVNIFDIVTISSISYRQACTNMSIG
jgi:hypothetical protein